MGNLLVDQLTGPVKFTQAARELVKDGVKTFVEVGPGNVLSGLVRRIDENVKAISVNSVVGAEEARGAPSPLPEPFCSLEGKMALVTGGSRGIGRAVAVELAGAGASVVIGYGSAREEAEAVAQETGGRAVQADVSQGEDAKRLVEEAGDLDVLVNCAGITRDGVLARMLDDDWRAVIETNLEQRLLHLPRRRARDDAAPLGVDREPLQHRRRARQLGPDELRRVQGGDHRLHQVARARARAAATCVPTWSRPATSRRG